MKIESKLTSKGQVTIPQDIRLALKLGTGDTLLWKLRQDGRVEIMKVTKRKLDDLVGLLGRPKHSATIEEMDEAVRKRFKKTFK